MGTIKAGQRNGEREQGRGANGEQEREQDGPGRSGTGSGRERDGNRIGPVQHSILYCAIGTKSRAITDIGGYHQIGTFVSRYEQMRNLL